MVFTDTHTHLYLEEFDNDRSSVIYQAIEAGVRYMLLPNIDSTSVEGMLALGAQFPGHCLPMMGLHPTSVKADFMKEIAMVENNLDHNPQQFYAIGEIGIDLYWDKTYMEQQVEAFSRQLELAVKYDLPAVIHTRNSFDVTIDILEKMNQPKLKGVFHCFSGNIDQAKRATALGFKLGIGGVVTYKNSGLQQVVEAMKMEDLLLETDAPFLTPVPHRGKRNESRYIPIIAQKISEIKNLALDDVAKITTENAMALFNLHS